MKTGRSTHLLGLALMITAFSVGSSSAAPGAVSSPIEGAVIIEGTQFNGHIATVAAGDSGNVAVISIDGRPVARAFRQALDRIPSGATAALAFRTDSLGRQILVGVRWLSPDGQRTEERLFRFAAVETTANVIQAAAL